LIFIVLPEVFTSMGLMGHILAPLLFLAILFAGFTSSLALVEPLLSSVCDKFNFSRRKGVSILVVFGCCCSLLFSTGISSYLVGIVDAFVNEFGILILIAVQAIIFTWYYDVDEIIPVLNKKSKIKVGKKWKFVLKYVLPLMLIVMWLMGIIEMIHELNFFKLMIYLLITAIVIALSFYFVKVNPKANKA
jgi:NSS family neurotransmitter:Na+ symporter